VGLGSGVSTSAMNQARPLMSDMAMPAYLTREPRDQEDRDQVEHDERKIRARGIVDAPQTRTRMIPADTMRCFDCRWRNSITCIAVTLLPPRYFTSDRTRWRQTDWS